MADVSERALPLGDFVAAHPWPDHLRAAGKPLEWLWEFPLTVEPAKLWPHLIDTSRLNRALGLGEMKFEEKAGVLHGTSTNGGVTHAWIEEPWTWVFGKELVAVRTYSRGFARVARAIYQVIESGDEKSLAVYFGWIPRGVIGTLALKIGVPSLRGAYERVLTKLQADVDKARPDPYAPPKKALGDLVQHRISLLGEKLRSEGSEPRVVDKLLALFKEGDELDLYRIQPRKLAHAWDVSEKALISTCLQATRVGLLDLSWDVICPHCRGVREEASSLAGLKSRGSCDVCEVDFSTDVENAVEVTFHVHGSIADIPKVYYCSAEPATKQHIKVQQELAGGTTRAFEAHLPAGRYRLRLRGNRVRGYLTVKEGGATEIAWNAAEELGEIVGAKNLALRFENDGEEPELFVIEEVRWADEALRPSMLFALQEFRDLFSEEYLSSDVQLSVGEQTLLFTDMVGSTAFYREHGDPVAFVKVKGHFEEIFTLINDNGGAVVKTIGDAVMAVFSDPLAAVRTAGLINRTFPKVSGDADAIRLRVSLNSGPCIAVNLNTGIDYFGATVNTAAKLQACAEGGEVALSRRVFEAPGVETFLSEQNAVLDERSFSLGSETVSYIHWPVS